MTMRTTIAARRLIALGTAKTETKGVASTQSPDDQFQKKPGPGLLAD